MATPDLRRNLRKLSQKLGKAANSNAIKDVLQGKEHYVYEFWCYTRILLMLKKNYKIVYVQGRGGNAHCFPKGAASKDGRPYFTANDKSSDQIRWQVCAGTEIKDQLGDKVAADISFQSPSATNDPDHSVVELIFDAKYKNISRPNAALSRADVAKFADDVDLLATAGKSPEPALGGFNANCILTNGGTSGRNAPYFTAREIKEVTFFFPRKSPVVFP